ncbi:MAG: TonB family protein [Pyrinomonadaceae bacterium]
MLSLLTPLTSYAQSPPVTGAADRERGIELYRAKNFVEAAKVLKSAVKKYDADEQAWYYLGLALTQQPKELKDASKAFETAIKLKPNFAAAHTGLSYVLMRRNKFSEALIEAQTAIKLEPGIANAHYVVGVVRLNSGAHEDALKAAAEAIKLNPKLAAAYLLKSEALWGMFASPVNNSPCLRPGLRQSRSVPVTASSPTEEQLEERRKKRKHDVAILTQSAESLETYLKLNPSDPSAEKWREQLATVKVLGNVGKTGADAVKYGDEVTTKARVLTKPEPQYTDEARRAGVRGWVVLRAIFAADGKVRNIILLRGLPSGLSWQAVEAARQVKFTPAMIDGKPVSMFVQMEYCFDLY